MVIAVLAGLFWLRKGGNSTVAGAQQVTGLLFFELLFLSLRALFTALFTFPSDFKMVSAPCHIVANPSLPSCMLLLPCCVKPTESKHHGFGPPLSLTAMLSNATACIHTHERPHNVGWT